MDLSNPRQDALMDPRARPGAAFVDELLKVHQRVAPMTELPLRLREVHQDARARIQRERALVRGDRFFPARRIEVRVAGLDPLLRLLFRRRRAAQEEREQASDQISEARKMIFARSGSHFRSTLLRTELAPAAARATGRGP